MKPTKRQRHKIYKDALKLIRSKECTSEFLCHIMADTMKVDRFHWQERYLDDFPEIKKRKPKNASFTWWRGSYKSPRIKCLIACIKETAPKPKKHVIRRRKTVSKG